MSSDNLDNYNGQAYRNFLITSKNKLSPITRQNYIEELDKWLKYKNISKNNCGKLLGDGNNLKEVSEDIKSYIVALVEKGLSYSMQKKAYSAIKFFFEANQALANWGWITMYLTKQEGNEGNYRAYDKAEIRKLWDIAQDREQLAMGQMFTGGPRVGPLPTIKIRHMKWFEDHKVFCCKIYVSKEADKWDDIVSDYFTFMSPQVSEVAWRVVGKRKPDNFLYVNKNDKSSSLRGNAIPTAIHELLVEAGLREPNTDRSKRHEVQIDHGFRKFFSTQTEVAGVRDLYRKFMMGQKFGIDKTYFKPTPEEILLGSELSPGYIVAIPLLTI